MDINIDSTLDCSGLACPIPIIKTSRAIRELKPGQLLKMIATDAGSVKDVAAWAVRTGNQLIAKEEMNGKFIFYIMRTN